MNTFLSLETQDRGLHVLCDVQENAFSITITPIDGESQDHLMHVVFSRGFARELRDFLNECEKNATDSSG